MQGRVPYLSLEKIMKIGYFENTHRDKSNDILYDIIYLCILVEKYGQSKLGQNYIFKWVIYCETGGVFLKQYSWNIY